MHSMNSCQSHSADLDAPGIAQTLLCSHHGDNILFSITICAQASICPSKMCWRGPQDNLMMASRSSEIISESFFASAACVCTKQAARQAIEEWPQVVQYRHSDQSILRLCQKQNRRKRRHGLSESWWGYVSLMNEHHNPPIANGQCFAVDDRTYRHLIMGNIESIWHECDLSLSCMSDYLSMFDVPLTIGRRTMRTFRDRSGVTPHLFSCHVSVSEIWRCTQSLQPRYACILI